MVVVTAIGSLVVTTLVRSKMKEGMGNLIRVLEWIGVEDEAVLPARSAHSDDFIIG
jgi:hypothetical protein